MVAAITHTPTTTNTKVATTHHNQAGAIAVARARSRWWSQDTRIHAATWACVRTRSARQSFQRQLRLAMNSIT